MHKRNVNTESVKSNTATAKNLQSPHGSAAVGPNLQIFQHFNDEAMGERDRLFGIAGRALNKSFDTAYAIAGMVDLVRVNRQETSKLYQFFGDNVEAQPLTGIALLSDSLNEVLVDVGHSFHEQMKGGE